MLINTNIVNLLTNKKVIESSIINALYHRIHRDNYTNFFEILSISEDSGDKESIEILTREISDIYSLRKEYNQEESFYYYQPKTNFFSRRLVYQNFRDYAIRFHLVNVLSILAENSFIRTSYSGRTIRNRDKFQPVFRNYYVQWCKFNDETQKILDLYSGKSKYVLTADITSFFDSVIHEYLIDKIYQLVGNTLPQNYRELLGKIFTSKVEFYSIIDEQYRIEYKKHGFLTGSITEEFLANILLNSLDEIMIRNNFHYLRYMDDIRVITTSKDKAIHAFSIIQEELHQIGLSLNLKKTDIKENPTKVKDLSYAKESESLIFESDYEHIQDLENDTENLSNAYKKFQSIDLCASITNLSDKSKEHSTEDICCILIQAISLIKVDLYGNLVFSCSDFLVDEENFIKLLSKIPEIIQLYPKKGKVCAWELVNKCLVQQFSLPVQYECLRIMIEILKSNNYYDSVKTRLIHHLIKYRGKDKYYLLILVHGKPDLKKGFIDLFTSFINSKSIDLSLNAIFGLFLLISNQDELYDIIYQNLPRPLPYSFAKVLTYIFDGDARKHLKKPISLEDILQSWDVYSPDFDDLNYG